MRLIVGNIKHVDEQLHINGTLEYLIAKGYVPFGSHTLSTDSVGGCYFVQNMALWNKNVSEHSSETAISRRENDDKEELDPEEIEWRNQFFS